MFFWKFFKKEGADGQAPQDGQVMYIIAGLGNPEGQYKGTRHNVGFETINKLAYDHNIIVNKSKHKGLIGVGRIAGGTEVRWTPVGAAGKPVALIKPQTYMNRSGDCVKAVLDFYKLTPAELIVIYDDVSLPLGDIRVRERGSDGGQKGIKDIIAKLNTNEFTRVRIGINPKPEGWNLADYVLSRFKPEEHQQMIDGITKAGDAVIEILENGPVSAMNIYNKKTGG